MSKSSSTASRRRSAEKRAFTAILGLTARAARTPGLSTTVPPVMRVLAALTRWVRGVPPTDGIEAVAQAWRRYMPSPRAVPLVRVEAETAYLQIRMPCPLRGSGEVAACHRLMAYDRALMAAHGARFVVLRSQAEPGVEVCEVAIRAAARPHEDLVPAHALVRPLRAPARSPASSSPPTAPR